MERFFVHLDDLPDEVLLIIFRKLDNIQVLYSLMNVNKRLNRLIHDPIFTNNLTLMQTSIDNIISPLSDKILDQFCSQILPEIHHKIQWLNIELSSIERIFSINYPHLHGLGIYNLDTETTLYSLSNIFFVFLNNSCVSFLT